MSDPISSISSILSIAPGAPLSTGGVGAQPGAFQQLLEGAIQSVQSAQSDATKTVQQFLTGESEELHTTALAAQRAQIAFDLGLQVRNKVIDAYQEIMRMQM